MTQLAALLSAGPRELNPTQIDEMRQEFSFGRFDEVCSMQNVEPSQLAAQNDETLAKWIKAAAPEGSREDDVDIKLIRRDLAAYVRETAAG